MTDLFKIYKPTKDYIYNRQFVLEFYETFYGIHDFTVPGKPLESVAMHPKEEYFKNSTYDNRLRKYLELDIHKLTGIDFISFLELPRYELQSLMRVVEEFHNKKLTLEEKAQNDIKKQQDREKRNQERIKSNIPKHRSDVEA